MIVFMDALFLDMDEAILKTSLINSAGALFGVNNREWAEFLNSASPLELARLGQDYDDIKILSIYNDLWATKLRPGFHDFFKSLKEEFDIPIFILTAGGFEFQSHILTAHDIYYLFDEVFSSADERDWHLVPKFEDPILVDNLPVETLDIGRKMKAMGVSPYKYRYCHIQIPEYHGHDEDQDLKKILSKLRFIDSNS